MTNVGLHFAILGLGKFEHEKLHGSCSFVVKNYYSNELKASRLQLSASAGRMPK
jgi:hypothetical protein